jgi:adenosylmethionine-8-amino-7-oxononanoate aminotransferase
MNPLVREREHRLRQTLASGLEKASCSTLEEREAVQLDEMLRKEAEVAKDILEPSIQSFAGMIQFNAGFFRDTILPLLLDSPLREEYVSR